MENGPDTSKCMISNGFEECKVITLMIICLFWAWMHMVNIASSFVYPSISDHRAAQCLWARREWHSRDSEIVRGFQVGFGNGVADGLWGTVQAALGEALWSKLVVGSVECAIDGMVVGVLDDALSLLFFLLFNVDFVDIIGTIEVSAVGEGMKSTTLTQLPVMLIDHQQQPWIPSGTPGCSGRLWRLWRNLVPSDGELHAACRPGDGSRCIAEHLGAPATNLWASGSTSNHSRAFWEIQHLLWERCWCAWNS